MLQALISTSRISARILLAMGLILLLGSGQLHAQPRAGDCVVGPGLGSTLLIPYFEVDPANVQGKTTLISVNNGLGTPVLTRLVMWTDWGVPTLAFDIYLNGFDVQTINFRDLFNGNLPSTGAGANLTGFPFCSVLPPTYSNPVIPPVFRGELRAFHSGNQGTYTSLCAGEFWGDGLLRGYATVDVVDQCSGVEWVYPVITPANDMLPYFVDGGQSTGVAVIDNTLWGDVLYVDTSRNFAQGAEAVSLWADPTLFNGTRLFTFYGRYSDWDGRDDRVPLPYRWDQRFLNGGVFSGGANMIVWRDTASRAHRPVSCSTGPLWRPMAAGCACMDEDAGNLHVMSPTTFPVATQRLDVSGFGIPYAFGWLQVDTHVNQSWVLTTMTAQDRFSATISGTPVEFLCHRTPP